MRLYLQEPVTQVLPDTSLVTTDKQYYCRQLLHGYYQFSCGVGEGMTRSLKFYISEGSAYSRPTVLIGVPGGSNPWEFMVDSGWKELSDQYGPYLILMEVRDEKGWDNDKEDLDHLNALNSDLAVRPVFCSFQASFYAVTYGDCADAMGAQSRMMSRVYVALALLGTKGMTEGEVRTLQASPSQMEGTPLSEMQWPVWFGFAGEDEVARRMIGYYRHSNHSMESPVEDGSRMIWRPQKGGIVDEHWCAKAVAGLGPWKAWVGREYSEAILTELLDGTHRYPGINSGALGQAGNTYQRGFKKFSVDMWGGYYAGRRDTYRRKWYVYVSEPASTDRELLAPFVFHGVGSSGDEIVDRIGWSYVADWYGFTIIMPTASEPSETRSISGLKTNNIPRAMWNTGYPQPEWSEDMRFLDFLYQRLTGYYPVNKSRVHGGGQSSGGMMSWVCAVYRPDYFTAMAPSSAKHTDIEAVEWGEKERSAMQGSPISITANLGCYDSAPKDGFTQAEKPVDHWHNRYGLTKKWADYSCMDGGGNRNFKEGLVTHYIFETEDHVSMLHLTETDTKAHVTQPSEYEYVWNEFMAKFTKDLETRELHYEGKKIGIT